MPKPPRRRRFNRGSGEPFQPLHTLSQILALQSLYYLAATLLMLFTTIVAGRPFSMSLIFSWSAVRADTVVGWTLGVVWILVSLLMVIAMLLIVSRSKLVLDFSLTLHFINLVITSLYTGELPSSWLWWGLQTLSASLIVGLGTWACQWRELRPISFGTGASGGGRGGGIGEGMQGGGGDYEMVPVKDEEEGGGS